MFEFITRKLDRRRLWTALKDYPEYAPPHRGKAKLKRAQAEENFDFFMSQRATRLAYLEEFLAGFSVPLKLEPEGLPPLDAWMLRYGGFLIPPRGFEPIGSLERYDPAWTGAHAGMNIIHDVSVFVGEYIVKFNPQARWALFVGDGTRSAREMMGYYHPCLFGIHPHHPRFNDTYPLYVAYEIFRCCEGSESRHDGTYMPSKGKADFYRKWGDENELVRRVKFWADPEAPPPAPSSLEFL
jgi:hypothetical protein